MLADLKRRFPERNGIRHFLVTEVTYMSDYEVCVAAIDLETSQIVRPLQWNRKHWPSQMVAKGLVPGRVVRQRIRSQQNARGYPHHTEDKQLEGALEITEFALGEDDLFRTLVPVVDQSISDIFESNVVDGKYVLDGTKCRSLGSLLVKAAFVLFEENRYHRPRLRIRDSSQAYDFPITDLRVRNALDHAGSKAVAGAIDNAGRRGEKLLLRIGLAHGWDGEDKGWNPKRCYIQVNGLIFQAKPGF